MTDDNLPLRVKHLGFLFVAVGAVNLTIGWWLAGTILGTVGGTCTGIVTLGLCPIGAFCGLLPFLMVPLAMVELLVGALLLFQPDSAKAGVRYLPMAMIGGILVGDLLSLIGGVVAMALGKEDEVQEWLNQPA